MADVGERPSKQYTLDRINNAGNYEPGNVRWATIERQNNNKTTNKRLTFRNETRTVKEWSTILDIPSYRIYSRLDDGWSVEDTLSVPRISGRPDVSRGNRSGNRNITFRGITKSITAWAKTIGMPMKTLHARIYKGWDVEKALTKPLRPGIRNISKSSLRQICADLDCVPAVFQSS